MHSNTNAKFLIFKKYQKKNIALIISISSLINNSYIGELRFCVGYSIAPTPAHKYICIIQSNYIYIIYITTCRVQVQLLHAAGGGVQEAGLLGRPRLPDLPLPLRQGNKEGYTFIYLLLFPMVENQ